MKPIGIDLPIRRGDGGFFQQTFTTQNAIKANIKNYILTNFGERPINPRFGNNLRSALFQNNDDTTRQVIQESILDGIELNFPSVNIDKFIFENETSDHTISISLVFSLSSYPNLLDRITVDIKTGN